jgi:hypothetical protein
MRALVSLLLAAAVVPACVSSSTPGVVHADGNNSLVSIGAGEIQFTGETWQLAWYVVDRATQTCWFKLNDSVSPIDCCLVRRVKAARQHITWQSDASCADPEA